MKIQALQVGSIGTNCYILCDENAHTCTVIDPGAEPELILSAAEKLDCTVDKILLTATMTTPAAWQRCWDPCPRPLSISTRRTLIRRSLSCFP